MDVPDQLHDVPHDILSADVSEEEFIKHHRAEVLCAEVICHGDQCCHLGNKTSSYCSWKYNVGFFTQALFYRPRLCFFLSSFLNFSNRTRECRKVSWKARSWWHVARVPKTRIRAVLSLRVAVCRV